MDKIEVFSSFLKLRGFRFTPQRERVLEEVFSIHKHFEAEDLLVRMRQNGHRVSKATIYRTLALLIQCGLLREVIFGERHSHYEHTLGPKHHHLICLRCGKIIEFSDETIENTQQRVCEKHRFEPFQRRFEIIGYCENCAKHL